jgi:cobalt/nickel transport system permease protein
MSHLHLPDGLVPWWLWVPALPVTLALLALANRALTPQKIAYQGALGALMLAAMAIPLGPLEFHLTLAGPVGILLGASGAFPVVFVVSAILAFLGHGGLTVVALNALVLGACAATASVVFGALAGRVRPAWGMALAGIAGQLVSSLLWAGVAVLALRGAGPPATLAARELRLELFAGLAVVLWLVGTLIESVVAFGIGRFLGDVHPALLPRPAEAERVEGGAVP